MNTKILLGSGIRVGTRCLGDLRQTSALDLHVLSGFLKLLCEWRALAQHGTLPVNDVYRNDQWDGDTD